MKTFRADLHVHTVLSPCGDLEMSPVNIVDRAAELGLDIIGITDHNSTRQCEVTRRLASRKGIKVLCGAEVTTREEAHCLAFFETSETLNDFQQFLDKHLPKILNDVDKFGYQLAVDEEDNIMYEEEYLLISALDVSLNDLEQKIHSLNGIFIPAHVDKSKFSLTSQLGFIPPDLNADALELSKFSTPETFKKNNPFAQHFSYIQSSDAHYIEHLGNVYTCFEMESRSFEEIKMALRGLEGRKVFTSVKTEEH